MRDMMRSLSLSMRRTAVMALAMTAACIALVSSARADDGFNRWLAGIWPDAQRAGVSRATFAMATRGLTPDYSLPDLVIPGRPEKPQPGQPEFVQTPAQYLRESSFNRLATQGRKLDAQYHDTLKRIESEIGVRPEILLAIWGRETDFGRYKLPHNALQVLATQGYVGRRKDQFRVEFIDALRMIQDGSARADEMRSSWAGAMGLTQFLPSEFYKYGVDFDHDGRVDIFNSVPDALAAAARQLVGKGWERGKGWAYEVRVPHGLDCTMADPDVRMPVREWLKRGFTPAYGRPIEAAARNEQASLFLPAGLYGPAFLTPKNFYVIKAYNFSDLYALFVGHLSDRIRDAKPFETPWAKVDQPRTVQLETMQKILEARGFYHDKIDGKAGQKTRLALGAYQKAEHIAADCWPTPQLLSHMGIARR